MKHIGAIVALSLLAGRGLAAQDTTKAAPAPPPPPAASPRVRADEGARPKGVGDRVAQDTRSVFPVDVGPPALWTKGGGGTSGRGAARHHGWFHGGTQVGDG